ncbi:lysylphosphatidylglycerol synthase transmembrane domain-containing protein [Haladaptatus salinisoli]|uniref:lysylphosphatidylglycerol synthase transmembrane domain-containing protein n=1 Tax=Haladaptatus salinisoli TaxID=2884876 RepID=UPI001D09F86C|nr:lysylphosphatidylglycerol synthase transmembrane domain-containing protein [Haladaptatus salinisoli]
MSGTDSAVDRRTVAKVLVGFVVAGLLLYLFGRVVGWKEIGRAFAKADWRWVAVACASSVVSLVFWSRAWDIVLSAVDVRIPFRSLVVTYFAATFADYATPFGKAGGGPFIALVLSSDERATYQESLAGVVAADLLNLVPFFTFATVGGVALAFRTDISGRANLLVAGLAGLAVVVPAVAYAGWRKRGFVERVVTRLLEPLAARTSRVDTESVRERIREFFLGIDEIRTHPTAVKRTLPYAYVGWVFFALPLYVAGLTFGVRLNPVVVLFVVPASTVAGIVPTPGGLGGVEVAIVALLVALASVTADTAAAIALVYRVASYWFVLAIGGVAALYETYSV